MPQTDKNINFDDLFRYNYRPLCLKFALKDKSA